MAVFLGHQSRTLGVALLVQAVFTPLVVVVAVFYTLRTRQIAGESSLRRLYREHVDGWMWFVFWSINSLVIAGELSFAIVHWASDQQPPWLEHAPLWCAAACTIAVLAAFILGKAESSQ